MIEQIMLFVISFLLTATMSLVGVIWRNVNNRTNSVEKDSKEIKMNYLDRFQRVENLIYEVKVLVEKQTTKCQVIQDSKYRKQNE